MNWMNSSLIQIVGTTSLTKKIFSIGIDVGSVNGAICVVDEELKIHLLTKAPTIQTIIKSKRNKSKINKETMKYEKDYRKRTWVDYKTVGSLFKKFLTNPIIYTVEKITARPMEGETSSFVNGNSLGIFQAQYGILNPIAYYEPLAITWKKELGVTSDKESSIHLAEDIFQIELKKFVKKGKVDDLAEALLLSFYGLKMYFNNQKEK